MSSHATNRRHPQHSLQIVQIALILLLILSPYGVADTSARFVVKGVSGELLKNVTLYLDTLPSFPIDHFEDYEEQATVAITNAVNALGYYQPHILFALNPRQQRITATVTAGPAIRIGSIKVVIDGAARNDHAFNNAIKKSPLQVGDVLNAGLYSEFKGTLMTLALSRGYFDADFSEHRIDVNLDDHKASIELTLSSGTRYHFGDVSYNQNVPAPVIAMVEKFLNFHTGEPFNAEKLNQLHSDLAASGYFDTMDITPLKQQRDDLSVPVEINVEPKTRWAIETGIGYSTDQGARFSVTVDQPWFTTSGHSYTGALQITQKTQELSSQYKIPDGNPLEKYYTINGGFQRSTLEDTNSRMVFASLNQWRKRLSGWDQNYFVRTEYEQYSQGAQRDQGFLLIPGVSFTRRSFKGSPMNPDSGYLLNASLEGAAKAVLSDTSFAKVSVRGKWLSPYWYRNRLILRVEQGAIGLSNITELPPSLRFFTGGDNSIRGYSYDSIGPVNSTGQLVGGRYLTVGSVEYNFALTDIWRLALFVDHGTVTDHYSNNRVGWKTGAGPGVRLVTPIGPVRLDLAFAVSEPKMEWRLHFAMGPDL